MELFRQVDTLLIKQADASLILYKDQMTVLRRNFKHIARALVDADTGYRVNYSLELPYYVKAAVRDILPSLVMCKFQLNAWGEQVFLPNTVVKLSFEDRKIPLRPIISVTKLE